MSRALHPSQARVAVIAVAVLATCLVDAAPAAAARANPQELWEAYPLDPGRSGPPIRLPADSAQPRPAVGASKTPTDDGGASAPLIAGVAIAALAFGAVAGRWLRRPRTVAAADGAPLDVATPVRASLPPPPAAPAPGPVPAPRATVPVQPPTPSARAVAPQQSTPPRSAPPSRTRPAPPPTSSPPRPSTGRFRRVAWPDGSDALWRCEIVRHYGVFHADFRATALPPGQRRAAEIARTPTFPRPGWGTEEPYEQLAARVRALSVALRDAGWEPVGLGREWFAVRFVWPGPGAPVLELPTPDPAEVHRS